MGRAYGVIFLAVMRIFFSVFTTVIHERMLLTIIVGSDHIFYFYRCYFIIFTAISTTTTTTTTTYFNDITKQSFSLKKVCAVVESEVLTLRHMAPFSWSIITTVFCVFLFHKKLLYYVRQMCLGILFCVLGFHVEYNRDANSELCN
jgi:hypothetical protein